MNHYVDSIIGHLGAAITQSSKSDDTIIMDHVKDAYEDARKLSTALDIPHMRAGEQPVAAEIERLTGRVAILEAEIRVMRKLPNAINSAVDRMLGSYHFDCT